MVHFCRSQQLTKASKQFWHVIWRDASARVLDLNLQLPTWMLLVGNFQQNGACAGELDCILDQVDQNLLYSSLIADQRRDESGYKGGASFHV